MVLAWGVSQGCSHIIWRPQCIHLQGLGRQIGAGCWEEASVSPHVALHRGLLVCSHCMVTRFSQVGDPEEKKPGRSYSFLWPILGSHILSFLPLSICEKWVTKSGSQEKENLVPLYLFFFFFKESQSILKQSQWTEHLLVVEVRKKLQQNKSQGNRRKAVLNDNIRDLKKSKQIQNNLQSPNLVFWKSWQSW